MYFNRGSLPWQGLRAPTKKQKYEKISEKKIGTTVEQLCKGFPAEFGQYLSYCRTLHFEDKPDYAYLRKLFRDLFVREGYKYDAMWDWTMARYKDLGAPQNSMGNNNNNNSKDDGDMQDKSNVLTTGGSRMRSPSDSKREPTETSKKDNSSTDGKRGTTSSKLVERGRSSTMRENTTTTTETKSTSFIKLHRSRDKEDENNGKGSEGSGNNNVAAPSKSQPSTRTGVRGLLSKTAMRSKKEDT